MNTLQRVAALVAGLGCTLPLAAAQLQAGQWSLTTRTTVDGKTMPPVTLSLCITPEQARAPMTTIAQFNEQMKAQQCRMTDQKLGADSLSYRLECGGSLQMTAEGRFSFGPTQYTGSLDMKMSTGSRVRSAISARHTGPCTSN